MFGCTPCFKYSFLWPWYFNSLPFKSYKPRVLSLVLCGDAGLRGGDSSQANWDHHSPPEVRKADPCDTEIELCEQSPSYLLKSVKLTWSSMSALPPARPSLLPLFYWGITLDKADRLKCTAQWICLHVPCVTTQGWGYRTFQHPRGAPMSLPIQDPLR